MADRECVLRFLTFRMRSPSEYTKSNFDGFLNQAMRDLNDESIIGDDDLMGLEIDFYRAMDYSRQLLGRWAFRKYYGKEYRLSPINKALFESWSVNLSALKPDEFKILLDKKDALLEKYSILLFDSDEFSQSISQATGSPSSVRIRFNYISDLLHELI